MNIVSAKPGHVEAMHSWFTDRESIHQWGGPEFRFPFTHETSLEDIHWQAMATYCAIDNQQIVAFGQYYRKLGRCHLARLAVDPGKRSQGLGSRFVTALMEIGKLDLKLNSCSLFIMSDNKRALACYRSVGFIESEWPAGQEYLSGISFMVTP